MSRSKPPCPSRRPVGGKACAFSADEAGTLTLSAEVRSDWANLRPVQQLRPTKMKATIQ
jgi:hypothetical protein